MNATRTLVYHGTAKQFVEHIKEHGLRASHAHSPGVRVRLTVDEAKQDARAWCAKILLDQMMVPEGMIAVAAVSPNRITEDRHGIHRVAQIQPHEITCRGPYQFPDIDPRTTMGDGGGPPDGFFEALEDWEALTQTTIDAPFPRKRARRS